MALENTNKKIHQIWAFSTKELVLQVLDVFFRTVKISSVCHINDVKMSHIVSSQQQSNYILLSITMFC